MLSYVLTACGGRVLWYLRLVASVIMQDPLGAHIINGLRDELGSVKTKQHMILKGNS